MAIENSITFGGVNSADFGIYISGEGVFNAPKRDVDMVTIPGRNGQLALDKGRFENIEVTYPAFNFEPNDYDTFAQRLSDFRNAICAQRGYQRLEDTFHPDEYRMATYIGGLDIKPIKYNTASEFDITFNCKPQRWLKDGETAVTIGEWGETETASGDIVTVENEDGVLAVKSVTVDLEPIQDLNGYSKPWVGGAGKNKLKTNIYYTDTNGVTFTVNSDGSVRVQGTTTANNIFCNLNYVNSSTLSIPVGTWKIGLRGGANNKVRLQLVSSSGFIGQADSEALATVTVPSSAPNSWLRLQIQSSGTTVDTTVYPMLCENTETDTSFAPYENICPISGHDSVDVIVSPTTSASDGRTYTTSLGRTVYGGTLDVVSGVLTVDREMRPYDGSSDEGWVSDGATRYSIGIGNSYSDGYTRIKVLSNEGLFASSGGSVGTIFLSNKQLYYYPPSSVTSLSEYKTWLASNPLQVVYPLATPQTYQLTAQQIELLTGTNNIWSDSGEVAVEYGQDPSVLFNPTLFESSPLLRIWGYGTVGVNGYEIELENEVLGNIVLLDAQTRAVAGTSTKLPQNLMNVGDPFTLDASSFFWAFSFDRTRIANVNIRSVSDSDSSRFRSEKAGDGYYTNVSPLDFVYGTDSTISNISTIQASYTDRDRQTGTFTLRLVTQIRYNAETGRLDYTRNISELPGSWLSMDYKSNLSTRGQVVGDSTVSVLGSPTIIDCDLGEAYKDEESPISLNRYVDLGSDLPTLAPGNNEITYDDTVTQLDITPRWWKI